MAKKEIPDTEPLTCAICDGSKLCYGPQGYECLGCGYKHTWGTKGPTNEEYLKGFNDGLMKAAKYIVNHRRQTITNLELGILELKPE